MVSRVRFGYVGCGYLAQAVHIPNFRALPECDFRAVADLREDLGQKVAARYGIPKVYRSHMELAADPEIEAVGVSGPWVLQSRIAEDLVRAGKTVFVEKPMAVSVARARAMLDAVKTSRTNARLMVAYMKRYDPGHLLYKQHFDAWRQANDCGRVLLARNHGFGGDWLYARDPSVPIEGSNHPFPHVPDECPAWIPEKWHTPYLHYLQQWTHNINWLRFLLADNEGVARTVVKSVQLDQDGLTGIVILEINGVRATVESGCTKFHAWEDHTQVYFEGGWLRTQSPPLLHKELPASVELYRCGEASRPPHLIQEFAPAGWSYREEARHFLQCVRSGAEFRSSAEDTLGDVELYEAIYSEFLQIPLQGNSA